MKHTKTVYFSLGSNLGNRILQLQKAIFEIAKNVGPVTQISKVYQSPSWGFEGDNFLNICIAVTTALNPQKLLDTVLAIEISLGRVRTAEKGYQSRSIDIDILYYDQEIINTEQLEIPHPQLHLRKFVLAPLADIAPQFYHPKLQKDSRNLLQECRDKGIITPTNYTLYSTPESFFGQLQFIAIEGNIGAGKTTLARKISQDFNGKLILERFADNPFLPKFYEDQARYAFPLEMSFLADRYQQFTDDTQQFDLFKNFMVSDYDIYKSLIFAKITLQEEEFSLYRKVFNFMYKEVKKPDVYVYLYQHTPRLLDNIKKRGRDYEQKIPSDYLDKINRGYLDFIKSTPDTNSLIIEVSDLDFVAHKEDYQEILQQIIAFMLTKKRKL